jgi:serine kinase of HPr protein (carbohydrate metabolism regulator)
MTIREVSECIKGRVLCCQENLENCIDHAFASDLMSDVLTVEKENILLITGLANLQAIRTAEMSDISFIIFARNKKINNDMIALAKETGIMLIESPYSVFRISGELYKAGVKPVF